MEGDELVSRMHGDTNGIFGEAGFRSGGRVNDETMEPRTSWEPSSVWPGVAKQQSVGLQRSPGTYRSSPRYRRAVPQPLGCGSIGQNAILKELHFVHDVRDSSEDFERSLDNGVGIEPGMFD